MAIKINLIRKNSLKSAHIWHTYETILFIIQKSLNKSLEIKECSLLYLYYL